MKITIETNDLTEARVLLRAAYEFKASHLVPVTEQGKTLGIPTDADNKAVDAIAGHDALMRQEPPKEPCAPCEEKKAKKTRTKKAPEPAAEVIPLAQDTTQDTTPAAPAAVKPVPAASKTVFPKPTPNELIAAVDAYVKKFGAVEFLSLLGVYGARRVVDLGERTGEFYADVLVRMEG